MSEPYWSTLGGAAIDYEGAWNPATQYAAGDVVRRNGIDFLAVNPSLGVDPGVATGIVLPSQNYTVLDRNPNDLDIVSTAVETTVFSVVIPAGSLGLDGLVAMEIMGDVLTQSGNEGIALRLKWGGVTVQTMSDGLSRTTRTGFLMRAQVGNRDATNSQILYFSTGLSGGFFVGGSAQDFTFTAAVDTTVAQTFEITADWATASVSNSYRRRNASAVKT